MDLFKIVDNKPVSDVVSYTEAQPGDVIEVVSYGDPEVIGKKMLRRNSLGHYKFVAFGSGMHWDLNFQGEASICILERAGKPYQAPKVYPKVVSINRVRVGSFFSFGCHTNIFIRTKQGFTVLQDDLWSTGVERSVFDVDESGCHILIPIGTGTFRRLMENENY